MESGVVTTIQRCGVTGPPGAGSNSQFLRQIRVLLLDFAEDGRDPAQPSALGSRVAGVIVEYQQFN